MHLNLLLTLCLAAGTLHSTFSDQASFIEQINSKVIETIENAEQVPGLQAQEFCSLKMGLKERWHELLESGVLEVTGTDQEVRPYFVALQAIVEHVLADELNKNIESLMGVIHTPMPATPLCTEGTISQELVNPDIENDPLRLFTVKARTTIIRDYLHKGGKLYVAYPKEGIHKRTEVQRHIYAKELLNYPLNLIDCPLNCESLPSDCVGAFYLFEDMHGKLFGFAIKMTQANNPQEKGNFGLWFGEFTNQPLQERIQSIFNGVLKYSPKTISLICKDEE
jgi:hypothetical protein